MLTCKFISAMGVGLSCVASAKHRKVSLPVPYSPTSFKMSLRISGESGSLLSPTRTCEHRSKIPSGAP